MKTEQDYAKDLNEIRSMMERSTRFLSLTGLSGILAGVYALAGAYIAYTSYYFENENMAFNTLNKQQVSESVFDLILLAAAVLVLAIGTAVFLSHRKASKNSEKLWTSAARRLLFNMAIPLVTGGIFMIILLNKGLFGFIAPVSLMFYGLALLNASKFTYDELKYLGITEIILGLVASYYVGFGLLFWAIGFGIMHILYGIYMHVRYER